MVNHSIRTTKMQSALLVIPLFIVKKRQKDMEENKLYKCAICGKEYRSILPNHKYCSLYCREQGRLRSRSQWKNEHPEYYRQYMKEYRSLNKKGDNQ